MIFRSLEICIFKIICGVILVGLVSGCGTNIRKQLKETPHIRESSVKTVMRGNARVNCSSLVKKTSLINVKSARTSLHSSELISQKNEKKQRVNTISLSFPYEHFLPFGASLIKQVVTDNTIHLICTYEPPQSLTSVEDVFVLLYEWYSCEMMRSGWQSDYHYISDTILWLIFTKPDGTLMQVLFELSKKCSTFSSRMIFSETLIVQYKNL